MTDRGARRPPGHAVDRLLGLVIRGRYLVLVLALALTAGALHLVLTGLKINTDTTEMISADRSFRKNARAFRLAFPQSGDTLVLVLDGPSTEAVDAAADELAAALRTSPSFPDVWVPGQDAFFRRNGLLYLGRERLAELTDRMAAASPFLGTLAADPNLRGLFDALGLAFENLDDAAVPHDLLARVVGRIAQTAEGVRTGSAQNLSWRGLLDLAGPAGGGPRRIVIAQPRLEFSSLSPAQTAIREARRLAGELGLGERHGVGLRLTGGVALEYEELRSAEQGGKTAAGLSVVFVLVLLGFGLRSVRLIVATLLTLGIGLIWAGGFAALAIGHLNLFSVAFAVLFVGLGVDFSIHFCLRYREEGERGDGRNAALRRAGVGVGRGLTIATLGAAAGFYAFLPTDYRGFAELGLISGTSMFVALICNFTVLPALLALLPGGTGRALPRRSVWRAVDNLVARHGRLIRIASIVALLAGLATLPRLDFDFDPMNLKDPATESFTAFQDLAREPENGAYAAEMRAPDLEAAEALAGRLARLPEVREARTVASFVPSDQAAKLALVQDLALFLGPALREQEPRALSEAERQAALDGFLARLDRIAPAKDEQGRSLRQAALGLRDALAGFGGKPGLLAALERRLTAYLPGLLDDLGLALTAAPVALADLPTSITRHWIGRDGSYRVQILPAAGYAGTRLTRDFVKAVLALAPGATGTAVIVSEASDVVIAAFTEATLLAVVALALLLLVLYRRPGYVVLALAPLLLAAVLTLATAVALGMALNFANVIVLPLLFGLGVASSVHLVERGRQLADTGAVMRTTTPRAVLFSTLTTLASFGSLALSAHRGMSSMGQLLTIAILFTLLCTLVVLPSMMPILARRGPAEAAAAGADGEGAERT